MIIWVIGLLSVATQRRRTVTPRITAMANTTIALAKPPLVAVWLARPARSGPVQPKPASTKPKP